MTPDEPSREQLTLLAHDLSNSSTILYGILDQLETLKAGEPQLERMASDLEEATDQIQVVTRSLVTMARSSGSKDAGARPGGD